jgi:hypothetical protein
MSIPINEDDSGLTMPEVLYRAGMDSIISAEKFRPESMERTNCLLSAIAHAMLGGLRDGLDYAARQANKPEPGSPISPGPRFEEDEDRP